MHLKLDTWQRMKLVLMLGELQGNVRLVRKAGKALDVLEMSDEDKEKVGYKSSPRGASWQDQDHKFDLDIGDKEAAGLIKQVIKTKKDWQAGNYKRILDLYEQLGITIDEDEIQEDIPAPPTDS